MLDFRFYLLNTSIISLVHDIHLTSLLRAVPIFPVMGGYVAGPLRFFGDMGAFVGFVSCTYPSFCLLAEMPEFKPKPFIK